MNEKQQLFENAIEELELDEIINDDGECRIESPGGYHVIHTHWIHYPNDSRHFAQRRDIYDRYSKKQIQQLIKNLPVAVEYLDNEHDEVMENEYSDIEDMEEATRCFKSLLFKGI